MGRLIDFFLIWIIHLALKLYSLINEITTICNVVALVSILIHISKADFQFKKTYCRKIEIIEIVTSEETELSAKMEKRKQLCSIFMLTHKLFSVYAQLVSRNYIFQVGYYLLEIKN